MKVLHVITGLNRGGAEGALVRLVRNDLQNSHIVVSLMDRGVFGDELERTGATVHALDMPRGRVTFRGLGGLLSLVRAVQPDVVQTWMYHADLLGGLAARMCGVRRIVWGIRQSSMDPANISRGTRAVARTCAVLSTYVPSAIVSCSEEAARVHRVLGYQADKLTIIPNGFECARLRFDPLGRARVRTELGVADGDVLIGMVARWDPQKDHANLLKALTTRAVLELPSLRIALVGPGIDDSNADLVALLEGHGLASRVALLGSRSDIGAVMSALDLHVLSSAFGEAFPNVVAEGMACGTPSVVTDVGDAALIAGRTGWVVPPSDPDALAGAIGAALRAMSDQARWQRRRDLCRDRVVERFSIEGMVGAYRELWSTEELPNARRLSTT